MRYKSVRPQNWPGSPLNSTWWATHRDLVLAQQKHLRERVPVSSKVPYDIALFNIPSWKGLGRPSVKIASAEADIEDVFSVGFPSMRQRNVKDAEYPTAYNDIRVTFGKVIDANLERKSFCHYSNDIFKAYPSAWKLEAHCPEEGYHIRPLSTDDESAFYQARVERNIMMTNTDMINGMSGSPLYNLSGDLIGIGSTVIKDAPPLNFSVSSHAVYIKAENIIEILRSFKFIP